MKELYDMIFKRKSMRKFDKTLFLTEGELIEIKHEAEKLISLVDDIKVRFEIVERANTTSKRGEYCLLMYKYDRTLITEEKSRLELLKIATYTFNERLCELCTKTRALKRLHCAFCVQRAASILSNAPSVGDCTHQ